MQPHSIFWPVIAQVVLSLGLYLRLGYLRGKAVKQRKVDRKVSALDKSVWPAEVLKTSNSVINQFEAPVIFYALCFMLWALGAVDAVGLGIAWTYVGLRFGHAVVHVSSNHVPTRLRLFLLSMAALMGLLGCVVVQLMKTL